jgi:predicted phosphodiesterase
MRILILSDIHSNATALEASLAAAEGKWDRAACLGDVVGYGPDPNEVLDRLQSLGILVIRGNHDKAGSGLEDAEDFNPVARMAALWTRSQLTPANHDYLLHLPQGPLSFEGLTLVHGAFHDEDEYIFGPVQALDSLVDSPSSTTFFGHTHMQTGFSFRENQVSVLHLRPRAGEQFVPLRLEPATQYLLNPGSVGQPRDGDPRAAFAIADLDAGIVEFWRIPYNVSAVQDRMHQAGLPEPLVQRIAAGR